MPASADGVVVVAPAWHSCGSYEVFKAQLAAFRSLGFATYFLAMPPSKTTVGLADGFWDYYLRMTSNLGVDQRGEAVLPDSVPQRWTAKLEYWRDRKRSLAYERCLIARQAQIPQSLKAFCASRRIRLIHTNHYFNLPMALRLRRLTGGSPVVCETHDVQSHHFAENTAGLSASASRSNFDACIADELAMLTSADALVHLNDQEFNYFHSALPQQRHQLIYPTLGSKAAITTISQDYDFLIVASANDANYNSVCWFLDRVWNDDFNSRAKLKIVGNIDYMFETRRNPLFARYRGLFAGRVENLTELYARSKAVIIPVVQGQGLAIKTVEALRYGKPLIYSPLALRGFSTHSFAQELGGKCERIEDFHLAMDQILTHRADAQNETALELYQALFSPETYRAQMENLVHETLRGHPYL